MTLKKQSRSKHVKNKRMSLVFSSYKKNPRFCERWFFYVDPTISMQLCIWRPDLSCLQTSGKHGPALESAEVSVTCKLRTALARAFTLMTHCLSRRRTDWMATMRVTVLTNPVRSMWKLLVSQPTLMELHSATETVYDTVTFWYTDWTLLLKSWKQVPWGCQHLHTARRSGVGQSVFMFVTDWRFATDFTSLDHCHCM